MDAQATAIFLAGTIFPALSLFTGAASLAARRKGGRHVSPVFVPLVGPILLTWWIVRTRLPLWLIPLAWLADIGTVALAAMLPRLAAEWWRVSAFTRVFTLLGSRDGQSATLSIHATGHYLLRKTWKRAAGETGITRLGEPGTWALAGEDYVLTSHLGLRRVLRRTAEGEFRVVEEPPLPAEQAAYALAGWRLTG